MNRRQKIIVSVVGIFIVLLALVGLTYAYFLTQIKGNTNNKSISVTTANLRLVYGGDDGSIIGDNEIIEPDTTFAPKTFTVTNEGNEKIDSYAVVIENFGVYYNEDSTIIENNVEVPVYANQVTTLSRPEDFEIVITCKNQDNEDCAGYSGALPTESAIMLTNSIEKGEVQTYTATLTYVEANTNQSADMNKRIEGKFNIIGLSDTVDLTGTVENYESGDYVQTNSTKRVSAINPDGTYKVLGLEAGTHKIKVCAADPEHPEVKDCTDEDAKLIQEINIVQGDIASGNNATKTITITEDSREATVNVNATGKTITIEEEVKEIEKDTLLVDAIINRAKSISDSDSKTLGYAMYRLEPDTPVASDISRYTTNVVAAEEHWFYGWSGYVSYGNTQLEADSGTNLVEGTNDKEKCESVIGKYISNYSEGFAIGKVTDCTVEGTPILNVYTDVYESSLSLEQDDHGLSYYYRGNVQDNYVTFADMCWRIVRIAGDGSTKLILEDQDQSCSTSINGNWAIPTTIGGTTYTGNFGYTKHSIGTLTANDGITKNSSVIYLTDYLHGQTSSDRSMATAFKNFQSTFDKIELSKLKSGDWCLGDKGYLRSGSSISDYSYTLLNAPQILNNKVKGTDFYYDSYVRLSGRNKDGYEPTLKCNGTKLYSWEDNETVPTPMYVGALTVDEVVYAGNKKDIPNNNNYLINDEFKKSINGENKTHYFLLLSPSHFNKYGSDYYAESSSIFCQASGWGTNGAHGNLYSFRPVINLAKGTTIEPGGDGTIDTPYVIK